MLIGSSRKGAMTIDGIDINAENIAEPIVECYPPEGGTVEIINNGGDTCPEREFELQQGTWQWGYQNYSYACKRNSGWVCAGYTLDTIEVVWHYNEEGPDDPVDPEDDDVRWAYRRPWAHGFFHPWDRAGFPLSCDYYLLGGYNGYWRHDKVTDGWEGERNYEAGIYVETIIVRAYFKKLGPMLLHGGGGLLFDGKSDSLVFGGPVPAGGDIGSRGALRNVDQRGGMPIIRKNGHVDMNPRVPLIHKDGSIDMTLPILQMTPVHYMDSTGHIPLYDKREVLGKDVK